MAENDPQQAQTLLERALERDQSNPQTHAAMSNLAKRQGDLSKAYKQLRQALSQAPRHTAS